MTNEDTRFRITTWPGVELPVPLVPHGRGVRLKDGWVAYDDNGWPPEALDHELAIRDLQVVDTKDPADVVSFVRNHGMISRTAEATDLAWGPEYQGEPPSGPPPENLGQVACHWTDVAAYLATAQVLARHVLYYLDGQTPMAAWEELGFARADRKLSTDDDIAWSWFQQEMHKALRPFHARVEIEWLSLSETVGYEVVSGLDRVGLFSALSVQVLNLLTEALPARRCANESCHSWFVRQSGRSEHGQHRTEGVIYCSKSCAKAQAQREYRRRNRKDSK